MTFIELERDARGIEGKWVLVRQTNPYTDVSTYLAGIIERDADDDLRIRDVSGRVTMLSEPCHYEYILIG